MTKTSTHDLVLATDGSTGLHGDPTPALVAPGSAPRAGRTTDAAGPGLPLLRPQRILVAGDDVTSLATLVDAVSSPDREVHSAACTDLALELALQLHFDLVVLHVDRPGADAIEVSHCIRACHDLLQPTIVIISRVLDEDTWSSALRSGADRVLAEAADAADTACALRDVLQ